MAEHDEELGHFFFLFHQCSFARWGNTKGIGEWSGLSAVTAPAFHFIKDCRWAAGASPQDRNASSELDMTTAPSAFLFSEIRTERQTSCRREPEPRNSSGLR